MKVFGWCDWVVAAAAAGTALAGRKYYQGRLGARWCGGLCGYLSVQLATHHQPTIPDIAVCTAGAREPFCRKTPNLGARNVTCHKKCVQEVS